MSDPERIAHRFTAIRRNEERVTPLELFFDLVFVLALTQCTALMAKDPTWAGLGRGLLLLGLLWWAWVGYAWLTSFVDPEEGFVRIALFAAMAALLIVSLCIPDAFGDHGAAFAVAYGLVRVGQLALFASASRDDPALRSQVLGLSMSTAVGISILLAGTFFDGTGRVALWTVALVLDCGGPFIARTDGWRLMPEHFAERHGLIVIIALGESIVAVGTGAGEDVSAGVMVAAVLAIGLAAALWWTYFDVVALVAARHLAGAAEGRERNEMARDSYSYLHLPMIAGIILAALGIKKVLGDVDKDLSSVTAAALVGGVVLYLLAHVAFRWRNIRTLNRHRLLVALLLVAALPALATLPALAVLAIVTVTLWLMITYEVVRFSDARTVVRHADHASPRP